MQTVTLSYSTINNCLQPHNSHCWLNKQMGIKVPDRGYFTEGKKCHRIMQEHVSRRRVDDRLLYFMQKFEVVEEKDFDEKTHFTFDVAEKYREIFKDEDEKTVPFIAENKYLLHGYYDGRNEEFTDMLEGKFSSTPWSIGQYQKSIQRKIYGLSEPRFQRAWLFTGLRDSDMWSRVKPRVFPIDFTDQDKQEAIEWIIKGIQVLEKGDFSGGLDSDGHCNDHQCLYAENCHFRN